MIPKIIHYCWFGGNPLPDLAIRCIASWRKFLPDYQIKEWNESNFNLDMYLYTKQAHNAKKYAYVTDVVRLFVLKNEGGIYLDTDVEILKTLDSFLHHTAFSGFESDKSLPTGIMASIKNGLWATELLNFYDGKNFLNAQGKPIFITNVVTISKIMENKGFVLNNCYQEISNYVAFYPSEYFCPKNPSNGKIILTEKSVCIHHFAGSWVVPDNNLVKIKKILSKLLIIGIGTDNFNRFLNKYKKVKG